MLPFEHRRTPDRPLLFSGPFSNNNSAAAAIKSQIKETPLQQHSSYFCFTLAAVPPKEVKRALVFLCYWIYFDRLTVAVKHLYSSCNLLWRNSLFCFVVGDFLSPLLESTIVVAPQPKGNLSLYIDGYSSLAEAAVTTYFTPLEQASKGLQELSKNHRKTPNIDGVRASRPWTLFDTRRRQEFYLHLSEGGVSR